jgi:hypothetical protein
MKAFLDILRLCFSFLTIIQCISCRDDDNSQYTKLEGYVFDYYSNEPLSSIELIVENCKYSLLTASPCNIFDTLYTDNYGYFQDNLDYLRTLLDENYFKIIAKESENYANSSFHDIKLGRTNHFEFKIKPLRILRITLVDSSGLYDKIWISISEPTTDSCLNSDLYFCFHEEHEVSLTHTTQFLFVKIVPEIKLSLDWILTSSSNSYNYKNKDLFFLNQDTSFYELAY